MLTHIKIIDHHIVTKEKIFIIIFERQSRPMPSARGSIPLLLPPDPSYSNELNLL